VFTNTKKKHTTHHKEKKKKEKKPTKEGGEKGKTKTKTTHTQRISTATLREGRRGFPAHRAAPRKIFSEYHERFIFTFKRVKKHARENDIFRVLIGSELLCGICYHERNIAGILLDCLARKVRKKQGLRPELKKGKAFLRK